MDWMNRGLFGLRDINKRVLDVPWPTFDADNEDHRRIAALSPTHDRAGWLTCSPDCPAEHRETAELGAEPAASGRPRPA